MKSSENIKAEDFKIGDIVSWTRTSPDNPGSDSLGLVIEHPDGLYNSLEVIVLWDSNNPHLKGQVRCWSINNSWQVRNESCHD